MTRETVLEPTGFEAAIFDMDGLLIDSEPLWREVEIEIFGRLGVPLTVDLCLETKGMVVDEVTRHWHGRYRWEGPDPDDVAAEIVDAMAGVLAGGVVLKPGAVHALSSCRERGLDLAVASSSPKRLIEVVVDRLGLGSWFRVLHSAQEEAVGKPHPAVFLTTAALLGADPGRCVVFEDSPAGVRAAADAGMVCVAVPEDDGMRPDGGANGFEPADLVMATLEDVDADLWIRLAHRRTTSPPVPPPGVRRGS
jgi:mannitol-1-/sugar-/sorbitol-6-/2-deoxyglucose-6-phosphatase